MMDKNTIIGIILIIAIFIGSSMINSARLKKGYEKAVVAAEAEVADGNLERARTQYVNALRFKPNHPDVLKKLNELNIELGITPEETAEDTSTVSEETKQAVPAVPVPSAAPG